MFFKLSIWEIELTKQMADLEDKIILGKNVFDDNNQERKSWSRLGQTCSRSLIVLLSQLFVLLLIDFGWFWRIHLSKKGYAEENWSPWVCAESNLWISWFAKKQRYEILDKNWHFFKFFDGKNSKSTTTYNLKPGLSTSNTDIVEAINTLIQERNNHNETCITVKVYCRTQKIENMLANDTSGFEFSSIDLGHICGNNVGNEFGVLMIGKVPHEP